MMTAPAHALRVNSFVEAAITRANDTDERDRLREIFARKEIDLKRERVELLDGAISKGFRIPDLKTTALSNIEFAAMRL